MGASGRLFAEVRFTNDSRDEFLNNYFENSRTDRNFMIPLDSKSGEGKKDNKMNGFNPEVYRDRNGVETPISQLSDEQLQKAHIRIEHQIIKFHNDFLKALRAMENMTVLAEKLYAEGKERGVEIGSLIDEVHYRRPDCVLWNHYMLAYASGHSNPAERFQSLIEQFQAA